MEREFPVPELFERDAPLFAQRAENDWQALMECAPNEEPQSSRAEMLKLREVLADALDDLTPMELFIFNACVIERRAVRVVARMLVEEGVIEKFSKSGVHNALGRAKEKLRVALSDKPEIQEYLNR